jgi:hypothetical protein
MARGTLPWYIGAVALTPHTRGKQMAKGNKGMQAQAVAGTAAPVAAVAAPVLVLGAKAPKHRVGHTGAAWAAITPCLPCTAATLAALPALQVPQCGGPKGNGLLYVGYALRRGWLAVQAAQ